MTVGPDLSTLGGRIKHVRLALAAPLGGTVGRDRLAALVAEQMGEEKPVAGTTVKGWEEGAEPGLRVIEALAAVAARYGLTRYDRAWVAFGDAPPAPPRTPAAGLPPVTKDGVPTSPELERERLAQLALDRQRQARGQQGQKGRDRGKDADGPARKVGGTRRRH